MFLKPARLLAMLGLVACAAVTLISSSCSSARAVEVSLATRTGAFTGSIYVGGAVNNPGLYPFSTDDSLADLVTAAGGLREGADISQVSLTIAGPATTPQLIDINRAEAWLLAALPGIGPARAADIVAYRESSGFSARRTTC